MRLILTLALLLCVRVAAAQQIFAPFILTAESAPAVTFEHDASSSYAASSSSTSHQWSHTCTTTDSKGALLIGISAGACESDINITAVSWGSGGSAQSATFVGVSKNTGECLQVYMYKVMQPHVGTDNIYVTIDVSTAISGGGISWRGPSSVSASTAANGYSGTASVTVSSASGRVVVGMAVAGSNNSFAPGSGVTERYEARETVGNKPGAGGTKAGESSSVVSMSLEAGTDGWAMVAAELIP